MSKKDDMKVDASKSAPTVVDSGANLPAVIDFAADAGMGLETADKDSFAIPFIQILQPLSPAVVEGTIEGAKAGLFINTISNALSSFIEAVPVAFQRRYLEWEPRDKGGKFRGSHEVADIEAGPMLKNDQGQLVTADGNLLKDTRMHFVLGLTADGGFAPAIISMSSTQIKKSKRWLSRIQGVQMKAPNGAMYNPPSFSHIYKLTSAKESNDKGTWFGYEIDMVGPVTNPQLYAAAKAFHAQVVSGDVTVAPPAEEETTSSDDKF